MYSHRTHRIARRWRHLRAIRSTFVTFARFSLPGGGRSRRHGDRAAERGGQQRTLEARGCTAQAAAPPRLNESLPITQTYWKGSQSTDFDEWRPPRPSVLTAEQIERGRFEWERFSRDMAAFMRDFELVLAPVAPRPAPLHDMWTMEKYLYTLPYSLTGQPVVVLPFGVEDGLPTACR